MPEENLVQKLGQESDGIVDLLRNVVERESPSTQKARVDQLGSFIREHLGRSGLSPQIEPRRDVGDIVWAEWGKEEKGRILVLCHIDTVCEVGSLERNPFRIDDGCIYGPGIFDMKSGVTATLKIQEYLMQGRIRPRKRVRFVYTTDEEIGSFQSRALIEDFARQSDLVLVTEPPLPGGTLKTVRKGVGDFVLKVHGRASHAGLEPEKGVNAIEELMRQVLVIHSLSDPERGTTVNVTKVQGGTRENVIPETAEATIDARFRTLEESRRLEQALKHLTPFLQGARLEVSGAINRPPMIRTENARQLFEAACRISLELGMELHEGETGGGSDGNFTSALGVPTLDGLGVNGDGAHALNEHVELAALVPRIALLARLIERL